MRGASTALLWGLSIAASAVAADREPVDAREPTREHPRTVDFFGIPLVNYNSDLGLGFGAAGAVQVHELGYEPYRHQVTAQVLFTGRGGQRHFIRYDGPSLIFGLRVEGRLDFRRDRLAPYFGPGNRSAPGFDNDLGQPRFTWDAMVPGGWIRARSPMLWDEHPFQVWAGYTFRWIDVTQYTGSLLTEQAPPGVTGGKAGQVNVGILFDDRDDETDPQSGGAQELAFRVAAAPSTASDFTFAGVTVSERHYFPLPPERAVIAVRAVFDYQWGDVPFFEWPIFGGLAFTEGVGGVSSVRGVPRMRFAGNVKAFANFEARWFPFEFRFWGAKVLAGGATFVDVGRVWQPNVNDGPWYGWHPGLGGGLRLIRRTAVLRGDIGFSPETLRVAYYLTVGHMF